MATETCPIAGYENFTIEYPDELEVRHQKLFAQGVEQAIEEAGGVDNITLPEARFYGCKAICSRFENAPTKPLENWPLKVFRWFMVTVYDNLYDLAANPPKN